MIYDYFSEEFYMFIWHNSYNDYNTKHSIEVSFHNNKKLSMMLFNMRHYYTYNISVRHQIKIVMEVNVIIVVLSIDVSFHKRTLSMMLFIWGIIARIWVTPSGWDTNCDMGLYGIKSIIDFDSVILCNNHLRICK